MSRLANVATPLDNWAVTVVPPPTKVPPLSVSVTMEELSAVKTLLNWSSAATWIGGVRGVPALPGRGRRRGEPQPGLRRRRDRCAAAGGGGVAGGVGDGHGVGDGGRADGDVGVEIDGEDDRPRDARAEGAHHEGVGRARAAVARGQRP